MSNDLVASARVPDHIAITPQTLWRMVAFLGTAISATAVCTGWFYGSVIAKVDNVAQSQITIAQTIDAHHTEAVARNDGVQRQIVELRQQIFEMLHEEREHMK